MDAQALSRHERLRLRQEQHNTARETALQDAQARAKRRRTRITVAIIGLLALIVVGVSVSFALPGKLDSFAKCMTEKGAVMYGAIEWCHFTQEQAGMFGKSFKYVNYKDYHEGPDITVTPTWIIGNVAYEKVQSLERLSALTGCPL